jgi:hypothetical protein
MGKYYASDTYDATRDVWKGVADAYRCIRQRKAAGGPGWVAGGGDMGTATATPAVNKSTASDTAGGAP